MSSRAAEGLGHGRLSAPSGGVRVIECEGVSFAYDEGGRSVAALDDVTLTVRRGETVALLGPTGSGKSTLLQTMRGLIEPDRGRVLIDGAASTDPVSRGQQRRIGLVFQTPEIQLFAASAGEDVAFGPRQLGWGEAEVQVAVDEALAAVGLDPATFGGRHPYSLSGGEQRRLALAGVLAMRPDLLLLDEPFVSLDPGARRELATVVAALAASGTGLVLATHDVDQAWTLCRRRVVLDHGVVAADGDWGFGAGGERVLHDHGLELPFLVDLWGRLGREVAGAPHTTAEAAEALS